MNALVQGPCVKARNCRGPRINLVTTRDRRGGRPWNCCPAYTARSRHRAARLAKASSRRRPIGGGVCRCSRHLRRCPHVYVSMPAGPTSPWPKSIVLNAQDCAVPASAAPAPNTRWSIATRTAAHEPDPLVSRMLIEAGCESRRRSRARSDARVKPAERVTTGTPNISTRSCPRKWSTAVDGCDRAYPTTALAHTTRWRSVSEGPCGRGKFLKRGSDSANRAAITPSDQVSPMAAVRLRLRGSGIAD